MIVFAGIVPHPPILIPEIGGEESQKVEATKKAYDKIATDLAAAEPDVIIAISPHMMHYPHLFTVCGMTDLTGSFEAFGHPEMTWVGHNDVELAEEIVDQSEDQKLPAILYENGEGRYEIDHGIMVPLHFLLAKNDNPVRILPVSYSYATRAEHYSFGQIISEVCGAKSDLRVAVIASGDLSHRLIGPIEKTAKKFDREFLDMIKKGDEYAVMNIEEDYLESIGECAYRSVIVLLGALSGLEYKPEVYSYEGPFGVGYAVVNMNVKES